MNCCLCPAHCLLLRRLLQQQLILIVERNKEKNDRGQEADGRMSGETPGASPEEEGKAKQSGETPGTPTEEKKARKKRATSRCGKATLRQLTEVRPSSLSEVLPVFSQLHSQLPEYLLIAPAPPASLRSRPVPASKPAPLKTRVTARP